MILRRRRAPIAGRISDRRIDAGNLVSGGGGTAATLLTTINAVDPLYFESGYYVGPDGQTTNAVENFFGTFKRGMVGVYRKAEAQHLQRYVTEYAFRHNNRAGLGVNDTMRAETLLKGIEGKRLTYRSSH